MTVHFHARRVQASEECETVVVSLDEVGEGAEYLLFQRGLAEESASDPKCPEADIYLERRGQGWSAQGGIVRCELHRNYLRLRVSGQTARRIGGDSDFEVTFELEDRPFLNLRRLLGELFAGCSCFEDRSSGEPFTRRPPDAFSEALELLCRELLGLPNPRDASAHNLLRQVEAHWRRTLPSPLRQYYLRLGENRTLAHEHGCLLSPECLELVDDSHLVFFFGGGLFGDDWCGLALDALSLEDPPVWRQVFDTDDDYHWEPECRKLSWFLLRTVCWQALWTLPHHAAAHAGPEVVACSATRFRLVAPAEPYENEMLAYAEAGAAVCVFPARQCLYVGAATDERLRSFEQELGLPLQRL